MKDSTRLLAPVHGVPDGWKSLSPPIHRGSTIIFDTFEDFLDRGSRLADGYSYGQNGSPTTWELAQAIARLEGTGHTVLLPTGLAAIVLVSTAVLQAGDEILIPSSVYDTTRESLEVVFARWDITASVYAADSLVDLSSRIGDKTRLIWTESPGSNSFEVQDIPAIVEIARKHSIQVGMDNTWSTPLGFKPLLCGVDFSVQALTKYVGGHSDLLMGAVTVRDIQTFTRLRQFAELLGYYVAPDECALALRGIGTLALRMQRHASSALSIAQWLALHPRVDVVNYPPMPGSAGHAIWKRDHCGAAGALSFKLKDASRFAASALVGRLALFRLGASWGGLHSLVAPVPLSDGSFLIRLHVGLEDCDDLIRELEEALAAI